MSNKHTNKQKQGLWMWHHTCLFVVLHSSMQNCKKVLRTCELSNIKLNELVSLDLYKSLLSNSATFTCQLSDVSTLQSLLSFVMFCNLEIRNPNNVTDHRSKIAKHQCYATTCWTRQSRWSLFCKNCLSTDLKLKRKKNKQRKSTTSF